MASRFRSRTPLLKPGSPSGGGSPTLVWGFSRRYCQKVCLEREEEQAQGCQGAQPEEQPPQVWAGLDHSTRSTTHPRDLTMLVFCLEAPSLSEHTALHGLSFSPSSCTGYCSDFKPRCLPSPKAPFVSTSILLVSQVDTGSCDCSHGCAERQNHIPSALGEPPEVLPHFNYLSKQPRNFFGSFLSPVSENTPHHTYTGCSHLQELN